MGNQEKKADDGKVRMGLVIYQFANALLGVAKVLTFGARKYPCERTHDRSWVEVDNCVERYADAFGRHFVKVAGDIEAFITDERGYQGRIKAIDEETGQLEIDHCITNLLFLRKKLYGTNVDLKIKEPANVSAE